MPDLHGAGRRRQYCGRCNKMMFEFFVSPDGHYGLITGIANEHASRPREVTCPTCGARYELLEKVDALSQPVARKFRGV